MDNHIEVFGDGKTTLKKKTTENLGYLTLNISDAGPLFVKKPHFGQGVHYQYRGLTKRRRSQQFLF